MEQHEKAIARAIKHRRSVYPKDYTTEEIPRWQVEEMLNAAGEAPNHKQTAPWRFEVFMGAGRQRLAAMLQQAYQQTTPAEKFTQKTFDDIAERVQKSQAVIVVGLKPQVEKVPHWEEVAALGAAVQNMWLAAAEMEIGMYWASPGYMKALPAILAMEEGQECLGLVYAGKHQQQPVVKNKPAMAERVKWHEA